MQKDTWGSGVVGRPSVFLTKNGEQHAFARGKDGSLKHWWWAPNGGGQILSNTWGSGIVQDPTTKMIGDQQHVWATAASGSTLHWWWDPATGSLKSDNWGK